MSGPPLGLRKVRGEVKKLVRTNRKVEVGRGALRASQSWGDTSARFFSFAFIFQRPDRRQIASPPLAVSTFF